MVGNSQVSVMPNWKLWFIKAAGLGVGFAVAGGLLLGIALWWSSRPAKPKPWNHQAITATYEDVRTEGDNNNIAFDYTLQNNTDTDYRIQDGTNVHLAAHLHRSNSLSFSHTDTITVSYPIYLPARSRAHLSVQFAYPTPLKENYDASTVARHDFETKLAKYVVNELTNIDGIVLLDDGSRYQIDMPDGWTSRSKEPLRTAGGQ